MPAASGSIADSGGRGSSSRSNGSRTHACYTYQNLNPIKVLKGELDARLVSPLETHYDAIHRTLEEAQGMAVRECKTFREALKGTSVTR
jgi:hypothetical protein